MQWTRSNQAALCTFAWERQGSYLRHRLTMTMLFTRAYQAGWVKQSSQFFGFYVSNFKPCFSGAALKCKVWHEQLFSVAPDRQGYLLVSVHVVYNCTLNRSGASRGKTSSAVFWLQEQTHVFEQLIQHKYSWACQEKASRIVVTRAHKKQGAECFTMAQARESSVVELMDKLTMGNNNEGGEMIAQLPIVNINEKLPPELLTAVFQFLPYDDLKNALRVCRWV